MENVNGSNPVFVIGAPRSGTTLLRYVLCAHPHIYIPPESNFITSFLALPPQRPLRRAQAIRLMQDVLAYKVFFRDWQAAMPDPAAFVDRLPDMRPATLLRVLYQAYARQHGARRWGDKSPIYADHVAEIATLFPQAQFVHIIRDGRDVALSMLKAYRGARFFYVDLCYAALSWRRRVRRARTAGNALGPARYFELQYRELTAVPQATVPQLCAFLGEPFAPEMLTPHQVAARQYHSTGIHAATQRPLSTRSVDRWRTQMSPSEQRLFQALAGDLLAELGYDEPVGHRRLTVGERLRLGGLRSKYVIVEAGRRALKAMGVMHPAALAAKLSRRRR